MKNTAEKQALYETPYGLYKFSYRENYITGIARCNALAEDRGEPSALTDVASCQLNEYFSGKRQKFDFPFLAEGTVFQQKVWRVLQDIPYGETRSYKDIATIIGNPKASRAVGMANNKNPLAILIPCHRVIGAKGKLVGYAAGLELKRELLEKERIFKDEF